MDVLIVGIALVLPYVVACAARVNWRGRGDVGALSAAAWSGVTICAASVVVLAERAPVRAGVIIMGGLVAIRVYSYGRSAVRGGVWDYLRFLSIGLLSPHLVYSPHRPAGRRVVYWREAMRAIVAVAVVAGGSAATMWLVRHGPGRGVWVVNHLIVLAGFVTVMTAVGQALVALWRVTGVRARPIVDRVWASRTPAEFWRRWSWPIHLWLYEYVYVPAGGTRRPVRAVVAVFAVSALLHEVLAGVATRRVTGYQSLFFGLSALGVLASPGLARLGRVAGMPVQRGVTLVLLAATAVPMFMTIDEVIGLYAAGTR